MDITPIINAVIALVAAVVSAVLIPWIRGKVGAQKMSEMQTWVDIAVTAAEQIYGSEYAKGKKKYVLRFLESKGYSVSSDEVENAIEAAVLRLHSQLYGSWEVAENE